MLTKHSWVYVDWLFSKYTHTQTHTSSIEFNGQSQHKSSALYTDHVVMLSTVPAHQVRCSVHVFVFGLSLCLERPHSFLLSVRTHCDVDGLADVSAGSATEPLGHNRPSALGHNNHRQYLCGSLGRIQFQFSSHTHTASKPTYIYIFVKHTQKPNTHARTQIDIAHDDVCVWA